MNYREALGDMARALIAAAMVEVLKLLVVWFILG
jgi:hypothetical protein